MDRQIAHRLGFLFVLPVSRKYSIFAVVLTEVLGVMPPNKGVRKARLMGTLPQ